MSLVKWTLIGLLVLPAAELLAFLLVAALLGWLAAAGLFIATSIVGVLLFRRSGRADLDRLRAAFARDGIRALHLETPGMATMLGGILLIFPGFITDVLGAALFLPAIRRWVAAKFATRRPRTPRDDRVIDLELGEWHQIPERRRNRRRKSKRGV
jgi:UPF0716 protein FxsA